MNRHCVVESTILIQNGALNSLCDGIKVRYRSFECEPALFVVVQKQTPFDEPTCISPPSYATESL